MRKIRLVLSICLLSLIATVAFAHFPPTVNIDQAMKKQPSVTLDHAKHADKLVKSCEVCHHMQKGLKKDDGTEVRKCAACHLDPKAANIPSMREMSMTKNPMHIRCIGCHKAEKKGPVACTGCHKKK